MAKRKRKKSKSNPVLPAWLWMFFGLAIGLSVAGAIYVKDRAPRTSQSAPTEEPVINAAVIESAIDDNGEKDAGEKEEARFTFYDDLPNFEVVIPERESDVSPDQGPQAIVDPGLYVLQAGSFSQFTDADRRRAKLAMQGIESRIQRVTIDDRTYHRVRIGPIDDLDELNVLRSRLRAANIDVLRIRLGD
jgi:cell division protein FtsN